MEQTGTRGAHKGVEGAVVAVWETTLGDDAFEGLDGVPGLLNLLGVAHAETERRSTDVVI
jgi:hypothetical protein